MIALPLVPLCNVCNFFQIFSIYLCAYPRVLSLWHALPRWLSGWVIHLQCRRCMSCRFRPCVGEIPWRRARKPLQDSCLENTMHRGAWWAKSKGSQRIRHNWRNLAQKSRQRETESNMVIHDALYLKKIIWSPKY